MSVTPLPEAPNRNDDPETFVVKADAFVAALGPMVEELNTELSLVLSALNYNATSTTSVTIGTGSKAFTVETGKLLQIGQFVTISSTVSPVNFMFGQVTSYDSGTGALVVNVTAVGGSGTIAAWTISLSPTGIAPANVFNAVQTISVNGTPLVVDSANSTARKIHFQDAGVTKGSVGSGASGASLFDSAGTARLVASTAGVAVTGTFDVSGLVTLSSSVEMTGGNGLRLVGASAAWFGTGVGLEIRHNGSTGYLLSLDRATSQFKDIIVQGLNTKIYAATVGAPTVAVQMMEFNGTNVLVTHTTTASAANAFLDTGAANALKRSTSSIRYKKDIEPIDPAYAEEFLEAEPIWYRSKCDGDNPEWSWFGFSAEAVAAINPRMVHWGYADEDYIDVVEEFPAHVIVGEDDDGNPITEETVERRAHKELREGAELVPMSVQYDRIPALHQILLRQQQEKISELEARIAKLEKAAK
jgi:hypothetical protein